MKKIMIALFFLTICKTTTAQYNKWEKTTFSVSITKQTCKDNNNNYFIYSGGYVYKTTSEFKKFTKHEYRFESTVLSLHYTSTGIFLAGTVSNGIYKSYDANYWEKITNGLPDSLSVSGFASRGNLIFAATSKGVYYSSNNGVSWSSRNNGLTSDYNASNIAIEQNGKLFITEDKSYALGNRGVFKSTDNGLSWVSVSEVPKNDRYFFIYVSDENKIFISSRGVIVGTLYEDLFVSTDGGNSFNRIGNTSPTAIIHLTGNNYLSVFQPVTGYQSVLCKSNDNCANWNPVSQLFHGTYENFVKLADGNVMLNSPYGGNLKTPDGNNWTREVYGIPLAKVDKILCGVNSPYILGALANNELYISTNAGNDWKFYSRKTFEPINEPILDFSINNNIVYALTPGMIWKSSDYGVTYNYTHSISFPVSGICVKNPSTVFVFSNYIYKTTNDGMNWTNQSSGIPSSAAISAMTTDDITGYLFAVTYSNGIFRSTNNGDTWEVINNGIPIPSSGIISISANNSYVGAGTENKGFYYSTNSGSNWTKTNFGIATDSISYSCVSMRSGFSLVGTRTNLLPGKGLFFNLNFSYAFNYGLTDLNINSVTGPMVYYLFAAGDSGMYRTDLRDDIRLISSEVPDKFSLSQNYPNPFNPSTVIRYQLLVAGNVSLKVFDLLGKEVATLVNEKQNAGSYDVDFNSTEYNLPSGIYFYTLNAGDFKETKKMVLVK
ncbi:MAG: T9SS type A sorting domain-containing protein [Bacteroidetes bacterium]|nr:T9SS type A sorting domain-containing protein [Bacteroidota bacterium]